MTWDDTLEFRVPDWRGVSPNCYHLPSLDLHQVTVKKYEEQDMIFERAHLGDVMIGPAKIWWWNRSTWQNSKVLWTLQGNNVVIRMLVSWFSPVSNTSSLSKSLLLLEEKQAFVSDLTTGNRNHVLVKWTCIWLLNKGHGKISYQAARVTCNLS